MEMKMQLQRLKNNYHNKMEQMLNSYYENLTYNHEHASLVGEENQIVKVLGKNFLDSMTSNTTC